MSDRIFGAIMIAVALAFIASATQIQVGFLTDPLGPKAFPMLVGGIAALCAAFIVFKPDPEPEWPQLSVLGKLALACVVMIAFAYTLRPLGFLIPTAIAATILSYQIRAQVLPAILTGLGLSVGLFVVFKFALGLGLFAFPKFVTG